MVKAYALDGLPETELFIIKIYKSLEAYIFAHILKSSLTTTHLHFGANVIHRTHRRNRTEQDLTCCTI